MPLRPWALRNIREQSLPRTQLRTVDTQAERHLAALNLAPIKSDDPVLGRIEAASSVASHQRNGVRYPRKLKQIRRVQICEYEAMEELIKNLDTLSPKVRDTVFELIGVRADPDNAEEAERRANIEHTIFSPEFKRIMLKVGVSAQNPSRNNGEEAMRVEMPARSPRNSVSVGDGRQAVPMLTSVEGKGLLRGGAAGTTAEGGVRRRRETIAGGQVRFDGSTTYPQRSSAATFAESHRSGVHITSSNVIAEEPAAGTRVSENGGAQRRASLLPPVSEKPSVSRRGSNVLSPDTTSKQGRRRKSSVGHGGQQEAPLSEAQISAMRFAEILKQPDRYTQFINNGTATMPAIGPAITATPTAKELPVQQQGVTQLEDAADEYAEEWNESPIRNLAIELGQYIADMGNAQDNADAARKKQQEAAVNASTASIATTATTTTTSEEVTFEPLFRECRPVFALRAKTVAKLKANLRVNDERDPPDEHLDYLRTNANLPLTEYAGKKLLKEQRRRRRIEALREHYAEYERRLTMADRAHLLYKRIESVELQSMILNAKSEGLRNAMRAPVKANRGPRAASAGVTNEKLATTRNNGQHVRSNKAGSSTDLAAPISSIKDGTPKKRATRIRYGAWYVPIEKWKAVEERIDTNKTAEEKELAADFARYCAIKLPRE